MSSHLLAPGPNRRLTIEEFTELPDVIGFRDELIEGERVLTAMPVYPHTVVIENLEAILKSQFQNVRLGVSAMKVVRESGLELTTANGIESVPGPDLMVISIEDHERALKLGRYIQGRPRFVIEVISPTEKKPRRLQKIALYFEAGAEAVVEVIYAKRTVLIHRPEVDIPESITDRVTWPFRANLIDIFMGITS